MGYLRQYWSRYSRLFLLCVLFVSMEAVCDLLQPTIMAQIIDKGIRGGDFDTVLRLGGLMLLITGLGAVFACLRNVISSNVSQRFGARLRSDLYARIQQMSLSGAEGIGAASLITRLTGDVTQVQTFFNGLMRVFVKAPLLCVGSIVMATVLSPLMAPVILAAVAVVAALITASMRMGYPRFMRVQEVIDRLNTVMREYLIGVRLVKAFGRFGHERGRFGAANDDLSSSTVSAARVMSVFSPFMSLTISLGIVGILALGGFLADAGRLEVGKVVAFTNYMTQILTSLVMISSIFNVFVRTRASARRIGEVFSQPLEQGGEKPAPGDDSGVVFSHVTFAYPGAAGSALRDVSFAVPRGETLGVIGPTGSGKSTLASLLLRFYEPQEGEIRFGGVPLREIGHKDLRERIALVPQQSMLFSGSVRENLYWGREEADGEALMEAARTAAAEDFILAMPQGVDSPLGQGGVNLSGGQRQRVSIARALLRRPRLLILDDCTSALDAVTESRVRRALRQYSRDMTCILISQRIGTVMAADRILVLDNGEVAGYGEHRELIRTCQVYREIFVSQLGEEAGKDVG